MTYLRHRSTVALILLLLTVICVKSTGALQMQRPDADAGRNMPTCHRGRGKLFVKFDRRFDLKPVFLLPSRIICLGDPAVRPLVSFSCFLCVLPTGVDTTARWRGPPGSSLHC